MDMEYYWSGGPNRWKLHSRDRAGPHLHPWEFEGEVARWVGTDSHWQGMLASGESGFFPTEEAAKAWVEATVRLIAIND